MDRVTPCSWMLCLVPRLSPLWGSAPPRGSRRARAAPSRRYPPTAVRVSRAARSARRFIQANVGTKRSQAQAEASACAKCMPRAELIEPPQARSDHVVARPVALRSPTVPKAATFVLTTDSSRESACHRTAEQAFVPRHYQLHPDVRRPSSAARPAVRWRAGAW
jgi:hypothetical protein